MDGVRGRIAVPGAHVVTPGEVPGAAPFIRGGCFEIPANAAIEHVAYDPDEDVHVFRVAGSFGCELALPTEVLARLTWIWLESGNGEIPARALDRIGHGVRARMPTVRGDDRG